MQNSIIFVDLSMLALMEVTARVLVVLSGSFTSQIETGPTLMWFSNSRGVHSPQCWRPGFNTEYTMPAVTRYLTQPTAMPGGCANHYTIPSLKSQDITFSVDVPDCADRGGLHPAEPTLASVSQQLSQLSSSQLRAPATWL